MIYLWLLLSFIAPAVHAWDDDGRYIQANRFQPDYQRRVEPPEIVLPPPQSFTEKIQSFAREVFKGGVEGDFIQKPNIQNIIGQVAVDFSPMTVIATVRDTSANFMKSAESGFREHKLATAMSAMVAVHMAKDVSRVSEAFKIERSLAEAVRKDFVTTLPRLEGSYAAAFDGPITSLTLRKGEIIYRTPSSLAEPAREPGRWFGILGVDNKKASNWLYNHEAWRNANEKMRRYEVTQDVTVYFGKVKDGAGYQFFVPHNVEPKDVFKWTETWRLKN